jgi:hypothetical protein
MEALSIVGDNGVIFDLYHLVNHYLSYGYNSHKYSPRLEGWKRCMEKHHNTRDKYCLVFDEYDITVLAKVAICYLKGESTTSAISTMCTEILDNINDGWGV